MLLNDPKHLLSWLTFTLDESIHTQSFDLIESISEHEEEADIKYTNCQLSFALRQSLQDCVFDRSSTEPL